VAKLADALDSGSSARKGVRVQIPASAPPSLPRFYQGFRRYSAAFLGSGGTSLPLLQLDPQANVKIDLDEVKEIRGAWAYGHARAVSAL
jgi:hypothetical protein